MRALRKEHTAFAPFSDIAQKRGVGIGGRAKADDADRPAVLAYGVQQALILAGLFGVGGIGE